jgi:hypothetical protein
MIKRYTQYLIIYINADSAVRREEIKSRFYQNRSEYKVGAFPDDVEVVCKSDQISELRIFEKMRNLNSDLEYNSMLKMIKLKFLPRKMVGV